MDIIRVAHAGGEIVRPDLLKDAEPVHRQLRPQIPENYAGTLTEIFKHGAEMVVAMNEGAVAGVLVYRIQLDTLTGRFLYINDLVADSTGRGKGVGKALMDYAVAEAKNRDCVAVSLSSGTQREQAHRFYFREGFTIKAFSFSRAP
jgi:GNAT superfamily N-acetyltransferase